ncbi:gene transfer agent family protein [Novosphingobium pentaromativorans]|uniref:Uncharacterized protein n=1 Tax=Novosphingobium pentaromativorans US6-1 TaxID=1088721 RepID=G6E7K5_9SPHN|nr:gene transfer agent family protein [Novosphingobium pentaromativorans]EHJ62828.1 hypothetical protein NSU_0340 [Novosphingobium pentaromativorans US6-1]
MQTHRDIPFGDGDYTFRLGMAQIIAIEEKCNARIGAIYAHVMDGRYQKDGVSFGYGLQANFGLREVMEICRQGLIGGGAGFVDGRDIKVTDHLATHLVRTYLEPDSGNPLTKAWDLAEVIMSACVNGYEPAQAEAQKKP